MKKNLRDYMNGKRLKKKREFCLTLFFLWNGEKIGKKEAYIKADIRRTLF